MGGTLKGRSLHEDTVASLLLACMKLEDRVVRLSLPPTESIRANYERSRSILVAQTDRLLLVDVTSILPSGGSKNVPHHRYHMYVRSVLDDNEGSPAYFAAVFKRVLVEKGRYSTRIGIAKLVSSIDYLATSPTHIACKRRSTRASGWRRTRDLSWAQARSVFALQGSARPKPTSPL